MQPVDQHRQHAFHQLITEIVVFLTFLAKTDGVENERARRLYRFRVVKPAIGRRHPVDAKNISGAEREKTRRAAARGGDL